jgi:hypothetical protein
MKKCVGYLLSGIAGAVLLAGSGYVAYEAHFKGFVTHYQEEVLKAGSLLERWNLVGEGDEIAAKKMVQYGAKSGWVGFHLADSILKKEEVKKHMTVKGSDEGFDNLDFAKRDALLMETLEGGLSNIELRMLLDSNSVRPKFNATEYERVFKLLEEGETSHLMIRSVRIDLKNNLTVQQRQRLESCYDKLKGYENTTWNFLFHYDDTGACATPVEKTVEVVEAKQ